MIAYICKTQIIRGKNFKFFIPHSQCDSCSPHTEWTVWRFYYYSFVWNEAKWSQFFSQKSKSLMSERQLELNEALSASQVIGLKSPWNKRRHILHSLQNSHAYDQAITIRSNLSRYFEHFQSCSMFHETCSKKIIKMMTAGVNWWQIVDCRMNFHYILNNFYSHMHYLLS